MRAPLRTCFGAKASSCWATRRDSTSGSPGDQQPISTSSLVSPCHSAHLAGTASHSPSCLLGRRHTLGGGSGPAAPSTRPGPLRETLVNFHPHCSCASPRSPGRTGHREGVACFPAHGASHSGSKEIPCLQASPHTLRPEWRSAGGLEASMLFGAGTSMRGRGSPRLSPSPRLHSLAVGAPADHFLTSRL